MLINREEYQIMFEVEEKLWWYNTLHDRVIATIGAAFSQKDIKILDAGCGTGGMLLRLQKEGYTNIEGFDFNDNAVEFSKNRSLNVKKADILNLSQSFDNESFDLIISNDVLYQFEDSEIKNTLDSISKLLKPNGVFISNNQAFEVFSGTHDLAVGAKKRFVIGDFNNYLKNSSLTVESYTYWSLFMSPLILAARVLQKIKLKLGLVNLQNVKSDVSLPPLLLNGLLYKLVSLERKIIKKCPFGSSLFMVLKKVD